VGHSFTQLTTDLANSPIGLRYPVGVFAVDEMADDFVRAPGVFAFVAMRPAFGEIAQECVQRRWGAGEQGDRVGEIGIHGSEMTRKRSPVQKRRRCLHVAESLFERWPDL